MRNKTNQKGNSRVGLLLFVLILLSAGYSAWQILPFFYYNQEITGLMESQADASNRLSDKEIRKNLLKKIRKLELPIDDEDEALKINRFNGEIVIELSYSEVFYIDLGDDRVYDIYVFDFNPVVRRYF